MARHITTIVRAIRKVAEDVLVFDLGDPDNWPLPPFTPGAHIDVHLANGMVRPYSLCSDPAHDRIWSIAVRRDAQGRGGSIYLHDHVHEGSILPVSLPRNLFPLAASAGHHVFLAAGIGLTPFMPMIAKLRRDNVPFHLHMAARCSGTMPFADAVTALAGEGRATLHVSGGERLRRMPISEIVTAVADDAGTHIYACGPESFLGDYFAAAAVLPAERVHAERFSAPVIVDTGQVAFEVELARSQRIVTIPAGTTILSALRQAGIAVDASCETGTCGTCRTRLLAGEPEHRDYVLGGKDRKDAIMICVSGARSDRLVLDL
jgi:vanillate O-demethylase ferredoxin subunit